jgi:hypothetical protein
MIIYYKIISVLNFVYEEAEKKKIFFLLCPPFTLKVKVNLSLSNKDDALEQLGLSEVHLHTLATSTLLAGD